MKPFIIQILFFALSLGLSAQPWCVAVSTQHDPIVKEMPSRSKTAITIPVVVHILYASAVENISEARVLSQIEVLNRDFRALNTGLSGVILFYENKIADMEINFVLATTDPEGNPHSGIIRTAVDAGIWGAFTDGKRDVCYEESGGSSAWCTDCYLNIWVGQMSLSEFAGMGIFPTQIGDDVPKEEDGVYIRHDQFGTIGQSHLGKTTTHEIGHYLNLLHPWGANDPGSDCNATDCCYDPLYDDFVDDTAFQIDRYLNECPEGDVTSCPDDGPANYQNFMGYSDDECLLMFTLGQKARAWDALMTYRPGLLSTTCLADYCITPTVEPISTTEWLTYAHYTAPYLDMDIKTTPLAWQLFNSSGQFLSVWNTKYVGHHRQFLPHLATGIYFLKARKDQQFVIKKIAVMND